MKIVKYNKLKEGQVKASAIVGGGGGGSSTTIEGGGSVSLDREIWGQHDNGEDIDGSATINGNVYIKVIEDLPDEDNEEDDGTGEYEEYETGGGSLFVDLSVRAKDMEAVEDLSVGRHLYINYPKHPEHPAEKKQCLGEILMGIETDVSANKSEITSIKSRMTSAEKQIETNSTNIDLNEIAIKNNNDEIVALKNRTTANETALANYLPVGAIIMFSGTVAEIPEGWAICNGENGTPNLIGKFIKAWTTAGQTGGGNSITLTPGNIPKMQLQTNVSKIDSDKEWKERLNKKIPTLDKIGERVIDKGGSTHWCLDTGTNEGDNGLLGVNYTTVFDDVADYTYIGNETPSGIDFEPAYYSLIYIMKIA